MSQVSSSKGRVRWCSQKIWEVHDGSQGSWEAKNDQTSHRTPWRFYETSALHPSNISVPHEHLWSVKKHHDCQDSFPSGLQFVNFPSICYLGIMNCTYKVFHNEWYNIFFLLIWLKGTLRPKMGAKSLLMLGHFVFSSWKLKKKHFSSKLRYVEKIPNFQIKV